MPERPSVLLKTDLLIQKHAHRHPKSVAKSRFCLGITTFLLQFSFIFPGHKKTSTVDLPNVVLDGIPADTLACFENRIFAILILNCL